MFLYGSIQSIKKRQNNRLPIGCNDISPPLVQKHLGKPKLQFLFRLGSVKIKKCGIPVLQKKRIPLRARMRRARGTDETADEFMHATILAMILPVTIVFLVTVIAYGAALKIFPVLGLLDFPERYGLKRQRLPYPTGIVAVLVFILAGFFLLPHGQKEIGVLIAVTLLSVTSFIDDRTPLPSSLRLLIQIVIVTVIFLTGSQIYTLTNPFGGFLKLDSFLLNTSMFGPLPVLSGIFTIFWLLLTINALNWFDGIPGQVNVIALIGFLMLGLLALFRNGEPDVALLCFSLAAIAGAGILFDFPPGKMLMGDTGSMFFGLMLGLLGVYHGGKVATAFLAFGIPLIDAMFVILRRIHAGHSPFRGGKDHLHHLLLARGWSPRHIVCLTAMIATTFGGGALFLSTAQKAIAGVMLIVLVGSIHFWIHSKK